MRRHILRGRGLALSTVLGLAMVYPAAGEGWENVGSAGFSAGTAGYTSLAFYNGEPYVAYRDTGNGLKATVMRYTGGTGTGGSR